MTKAAELTAYVLETPRNPLAVDLSRWMDASPRFTAFVETYRDKIRKKARVIREQESLLDLRAELETAFCLLSDRRFDLAYEPYASQKGRGPDFAVTYRVHTVFNVEVARLRSEEDGLGTSGLSIGEERVLRILLNKLGQMQPGMANLLVMQTGAELARTVEMERLMQWVKARVEARDPGVYAFTRYPSPAAFYHDFLRLSGAMLWAGSVQTWVNKQARPVLEERVVRLVGELLAQ